MPCLQLAGARGTYAMASEMLDNEKPVLPMDLSIGSLSNDGHAATTLHEELTAEPRRFFLHTHNEVRNTIGSFSLESGSTDPETVARVSAEIISREFASVSTVEPDSSSENPATKAWRWISTPVNFASVAKFIGLIKWWIWR